MGTKMIDCSRRHSLLEPESSKGESRGKVIIYSR